MSRQSRLARICKLLVLCSLALVTAPAIGATQTRERQARPPSKIQVQAHRGGRALRPENTLPAFQHALELGVDVLELDLGVSRDGVLVVSHDPLVNPALCRDAGGATVPPNLALFSLPYAQIRSYDCGSVRNPDFPKQVVVPSAYMPTLEEVLDLGLRPGFSHLGFNIETKIKPETPHLAPAPEEFARLVVRAVRQRGLEKRAVLQSFDYRTLRAARQLAPEIVTSALVNANKFASAGADFVALARQAQAQIISPEKKLVTAIRVRAAHAAGLRVIPWTANEHSDWERLVAAGVDGIITDDPKGLIEYLKARGLR